MLERKSDVSTTKKAVDSEVKKTYKTLPGESKGEDCLSALVSHCHNAVAFGPDHSVVDPGDIYHSQAR